MSTGIRIDASGTFGALTFGGVDAATFDADGIQAGSYKAGSIVATDLADGALIENAPVGIGYGPGAGGTVIQATSKSTSVTLNKPCGQITMHNASLAAGATVRFYLNNSLIGNTDTVVVNAWSTPYYSAQVCTSYFGVAYIELTNISAGSRSEAVTINFAVIKGATY